MTRALATFMALVLAVVVAAGCGGDGGSSSEDFKPEFNKINDQMLQLGEDVGNGVQNAEGKQDTELADEFEGYAKRMDELKSRFDDLEPPEDLKTQADRFSTAVGKLSKDLHDIADAAKNHDANRARDAPIALVRDSEEGRSARRALAEKTGGKVGS